MRTIDRKAAAAWVQLDMMTKQRDALLSACRRFLAAHAVAAQRACLCYCCEEGRAAVALVESQP